LIPIICKQFESSSVKAKCESLKALITILENSNQELTLEIGSCDGFRIMFDSLCGIPTSLDAKVIEMIRRTNERCDIFNQFISREDAIADLEIVVCDTSNELAEQVELARRMLES